MKKNILTITEVDGPIHSDTSIDLLITINVRAHYSSVVDVYSGTYIREVVAIELLKESELDNAVSGELEAELGELPTYEEYMNDLRYNAQEDKE